MTTSTTIDYAIVGGIGRWCVTGFAGANDFIVINLGDGQPGGCTGVAGVTNITGVNVSGTQLMTGRTSAKNFIVIHLCYWYPGCGGMAGFTKLGGGDVAGGFTRGGGPVMTGSATANNLAVIHRGRGPASSVMAGIALGSGVCMSCG